MFNNMEAGDEMSLSGGAATTKRACEACRTRKVRCDRTVPCSNCVTSGLACIPATTAQKSQKERVHISQKYEKKIDSIEDRLFSIENVLENLASKLDSLKIHNDPTERSVQSRSNRVTLERSPAPPVADVATPSPFEGETTITSQSDYAREFLAQTIGNIPSIRQDTNIQSALWALERLVTQQGQQSVTNPSGTEPLSTKSPVDADPVDLELPDWDAVSDMLDKTTKYPAKAFGLFFPFLWMPNLREVMKEAYDHPDVCSAGRRLFTLGVLYNLFLDYNAPAFDFPIEDIQRYAKAIQANIDVVMGQISLSLPPSYENIIALQTGALRAIELCKPSLCSLMISNAAGMCQSLGYHRISTMKNDSEEERTAKVHLFWMIYTMDKNLSLSLGRASVIQEWDLSLPLIVPSQKGFPASDMHTYWVRVAQIQGQTYEKLFSPAAFLRSPEERAHTAAGLVNAMNQAWEGRIEAAALDITGTGKYEIFKGYRKHASHHNEAPKGPNETEVPSQRMQYLWQQRSLFLKPKKDVQESFELLEDLMFHSDALVHYSTCALIQRAVSPDNITFNEDCLESSRAALAAHMRCNSQFNVEGNEQTWSDYMHWSVLSAPFTPFIVIFCNAIQNTDTTDLPSLSVFVSSLESCRASSEGSEKLYKICYLFLHIARLYIQAKLQGVAEQQSQCTPYSDQTNYYPAAEKTTITPFDSYLSALGLVQNSSWPGDNYAVTTAPNLSGIEAFQHDMSATRGQYAGEFSYAQPGEAAQNPAQDWFWGSRYLINLVETGDDLQMPDFET